MYKLYYENQYNERKCIGEVKDKNDLWDTIQMYCDKRHFNIKYARTFLTPDESEWCIDVGSWSEFYYVSSELDLMH